MIFSFILYFLISLTGIFKFKLYDNILCLLCLSGTPLVTQMGNSSVFWYVSAMLWSFVFYFYLLKNYTRKNVNLFMAILVCFCYSFIIQAKNGSISNHVQTFYYIFNIGMMRALGGIGLGCFIAEWYKNNQDSITNIVLNIKQKCCLSIIEFMCIFFIINNLMLHRPNCKNDILFIAVFVMTIMLFIAKKGYISQCLEKNIWQQISKYTYSFYMTHLIVFSTFKASLWKYHPEWVYAHPVLNIVYTLILVFILGIFTYHFVEKPCTKYLSNKFKPVDNKPIS